MKGSCCVLLWLLVIPARAQDQAQGQEQSPAQPDVQASASVSSQQSTGEANRSIDTQKQTAGTSKDRLFFTLPNFFTLEQAGHVAPLTTKQKFATTARGAFDPFELATYGALAGISQARNTDASFGQGAEGYAKRYATRFGDGVIENFMTRAVFPSALHQDPRYYQLGKGGGWRRLRYAVKRIFITRSDSGSTQFNFSEILGGVTAAGISTYTYHPHNERNLSNVAEVWGTQVAWDTFSYVAKEFWPDIRRKLHRSKTDQSR